MSNTKILPTDKHGNVYYGPTTLATAENMVQNMANNIAGISKDDAAHKVACMLHNAGYTGIAARLRKAYCITE
jgi:hypothetical protein